MKLMSLTCPKCNAKLEINQDFKNATCNYCGYTFLIDEKRTASMEIKDPHELGIELEYGRRSATGSNKELASKVRAVMEPLIILNEEMVKKNNQIKEIERYGKRAKTYETVAFVSGGLILVSNFMNLTNSDIRKFLSSVLWSFIVFGVLMFLSYYYSAKCEGQKKTLKMINDHIDDLNRRLDGMDTDIIPPNYRYKQAMEYIYDALWNQRALTMQEAVNLYEDYLHKNRLESMQAEQLRKLNQLHNTAKTNAYINLATYLKK